MGLTGLVPAEYSSGERTRRGHITKAGSEPVRRALIEAAGLIIGVGGESGADRSEQVRPVHTGGGQFGGPFAGRKRALALEGGESARTSGPSLIQEP